MKEENRLGPVLAVFFRHGSNLVLLLGAAATLGVLVALHSLLAALPWMLLGIAMLPLYEYLAHRFLLHAPPSRHKPVYWAQRLSHYDHHEQATRIDRFFFPLWVSVPLMLLQAAIYHLLGAGTPAVLGLVTGNMLCFVYYEWVHYVAHVPYTPRTAWGQRMKKYHLWHHHKNENYWFGVTTPWMDHLFGSYKPVEQVPASPTARRLYGDSPAPAGHPLSPSGKEGTRLPPDR